MNKSEKLISPTIINKLYQAEIIDEGTRLSGQNQLHNPRSWTLWSERLLLALGTTLTLASVLFFFAYNWESLGKFIKFALIEASLILLLIGSIIPFKAKHINQILALGASFIIGVLLALIGQTYQTGANAWQLFATWALIIFPWVFVSKFAPHWALWLTVCNLALGFWMTQTLNLTRHETILITTAHLLLNGAALATLLYARTFLSWLQSSWVLRTLFLVVIINIGIIALECILSDSLWRNLLPQWSFLITTLVITSQLVLFYLSRFYWKDFISHALLIISLAIQAESILIRVLADNLKTETNFFTGTILTLILFTIFITYLRNTHQKMEAENE